MAVGFPPRRPRGEYVVVDALTGREWAIRAQGPLAAVQLLARCQRKIREYRVRDRHGYVRGFRHTGRGLVERLGYVDDAGASV